MKRILKIIASIFVISITSLILYESYMFHEAMEQSFFSSAHYDLSAIIYLVIIFLLDICAAVYLLFSIKR